MSFALIGPIGAPELMVIGIVALLMFGSKLPEVARSLGKSVNSFKKGLKDFDDDVKHSDPPPPPKSLPTSTTARATTVNPTIDSPATNTTTTTPQPEQAPHD